MISMKEIGLLKNIIRHCERIEATIEGVSKEEFLQNIDKIEICCFNTFQIGELAKRFSEDFEKRFSKVPWKDIKGMRDVIGHGYGKIDYEDIWNTSTRDIKPLHQYCLDILNN